MYFESLIRRLRTWHRIGDSMHEECKNTGIASFRQNFLAYLYCGVYKVLEGTATSGLP